MNKTLKRNKGFIIALFAMVFTITMASAQAGGQQGKQQGPPPLPNDQQIEKMVTELSKELSLTEMQEQQVSDLYFAHFEEVGELQGKNKNSRPDRKVMEQIRSDFETDVKLTLTKYQQKQFDVFMKEKESKRGGQERPKK